MICPKCGIKNPEKAHFCMECGFKLMNDTEPCPYCNYLNPINAKYCLECGKSLKPKEEPTNKTVKSEDKINESSESWRELCPACNSNPLTPKIHKGLLGTKNILECEYCGAIFEQQGTKYELNEIYDKESEFWQKYGKKILTEEEWTNIAHGGISNEEKQIIEQKSAQNDLVKFVNELDQGNVNLKPIPNPPIILKKNEEACVVLGNISLLEPRAVRQTIGGYGGPSFRVAKGVSFRMGSVAARSESHDELRNIDHGTLILTNQRLIFIGSKRTTNIDLKKIIAIEAYKDGIASQRENKQKTEYFTGTNHSNLTFTSNGRTHNVPFIGSILKAAVEGKIRQI